MRLAEFIQTHIEPILTEWESYARSIWPRPDGDPAELRDHAEQILLATVRDMAAPQSALERLEKSRGHGHASGHSQHLDDASELHGSGRVASGFRLMSVIAEYRALRASVLRLWHESRPEPHEDDLDDLARFNESIDQSLAIAVGAFTDRVDRQRQLFLAILGHDLRDPLHALVISAEALAAAPADVAASRLTHQITTSASAMARMIDDLLDFTGADLYGSIPLTRRPMDLDTLCREVIDETGAVNAGCEIRYHPQGDLTGEWDAARLRRVVSNLLGNAVEHGPAECAVQLSVRDEGAAVALSVHNQGPPIPAEALPTLFDPLARVERDHQGKPRRRGSLGLGLYIAQAVTTAHGGTIDVGSTESEGTTFTVRLPRHQESD